MTCPDIGILRAWIDPEPLDSSAEITQHIQRCSACQVIVDELRANVAVTSRAFRLLADPSPAGIPVPSAMADIHLEHTPSQGQETMHPPRRLFTRWRTALSTAAAVATLTFATLTPQGQALAGQFLAQFRGERIAIVTFDPTQSRTNMPELSALGKVSGDARSRPESVTSPAEAAERSGLNVSSPASAALPASVKTDPEIQVMRARELRFTFDAAKAAQHFASIGRSDLRLPDQINGTSLVVAVPSVVMMNYPSKADGDLGVMIAQAGEVQAGTEGSASLEDVRQFILGLPNLSESTARQLRSIQDWRTTLPIPVPVDQVKWQQTSVGNAPGYLFSEKGGLGNALIWNDSGKTYGVVGNASADELMKIARSLR